MAVPKTPIQPIVPAWKRLGLRLKNSPDQNSASSHIGNEQYSAPTQDGNSKAATPQSRKRKASDQSGTRSDDKDSPSLKRKKSVKFADDSKDTDGDETSKAFEDYVAQQTGGEDQFSKSEIAQFIPAKVHPANEPVKKESKKKSKKAAKTDQASSGEQKKKKQKSQKAEKPQGTPSYITYLQQFHTSHDTWKFHKAHQIALLKNLYNTYRVPFEMDDALSSYLSGLQSEATRKRLTDEARKLYTETADLRGIELPTESTVHKDAKEKALKSHLKATKGILRNHEAAISALTDEHQERLRKRKRAHLILQSMQRRMSPEPASAKASKEERPADERPVKRRRVRRRKKMLAGHPDDDETDETSSVDSVPSSSDEESSSDDDSGSDDSSVVSSSGGSDSSSASEDDSSESEDSDTG